MAEQLSDPERFEHLIASSAEAMLHLAENKETLSPTEREQILHVLRYALDLKPAWTVSSQLLLTLAPKLERAGMREEWIPFLVKGIERSQEEGETAEQAELELFVGILYRLLGKWQASRTYLKASIEHFGDAQDTDGQARALNRLSFLAKLEGQHDEANKLIGKAFLLCKEESLAKALCHTTTGVLNLDQNKLGVAQYHFEEALRIHKLLGNERLVAWAYGDLGVCQWQQEQLADAVASYDKALSGFERVDDVVQLAVTQMNMGLVYADLGEFKRAVDLYAQAEPVFHQFQDRLRLAMIYNNRGLVYSELEEWQEAEDAFCASLEEYKRLESHHAVADVLNNLGTSFNKQGDCCQAKQTFTQALNWLDKTTVLPDGGELRNEIIQKIEEVRTCESVCRK